MIEADAAQWGVAIGASLAAAILDVRTRRIPNRLTFPLVMTGLIGAVILNGLSGLGSSLAGCAMLAAPYVLLFAVAGGGAGDAKMMGAVGAWLGLRDGVVVLAAVALTGGVFGLLRILAHRERWVALRALYAWMYVLLLASCGGPGSWHLLRTEMDQEKAGIGSDRRLTIPYGPAIFLGVCIGAGVVYSWNG